MKFVYSALVLGFVIFVLGCISLIQIPENSVPILDQDINKYMASTDSIQFSIEQPDQFSRIIIVIQGSYSSDTEPRVLLNGEAYKEREFSGREGKYVYESFGTSNAISFRKNYNAVGSPFVYNVKVWGIPKS